MKQSIAMVFCFLLAGVAAFAGASGMVWKLEEISAVSAEEALSDSGFGWAEIRTDGLQVIVSGVAPSEVMRARAVGVLHEVVNAERVVDEMGVEQSQPLALPRFSIEILRNDRAVQLIGLAPASTNPSVLADRIESMLGSQQVSAFVEVTERRAPEGWEEALSFAIGAMSRLPRSQISADSERVRVTAIVDNVEAGARMERLLRRDAPDGLELVLNIDAPRPVVSPFTLRFIIQENGVRFDNCTAFSQEGRAQIIRAARDAGFEGRAECTLGLGVPSSSWPEAVSLSMAALKDIGGGSLTFADGDITLIAAEGVDPRAFETRMGALEASLPEFFSLEAIRPKLESEEEFRPEINFVLAADGLVQLQGHMGDPLSRDIALSVAQARFGSDNVQSTLRIGENIPAGWTIRTLAGIEALGLLNHGQLNISEEALVLSGITGSKEAQAQAIGIFTKRLGEGIPFSLDITYDERFDPIARLMGPEECIAAIAETKGDRKIGFEPGAAAIDSSTSAILDDIAVLLRDCYDVQLEIGGHTDSQGRESMNMALSQARAETILQELTARRVSTSGFVAKGYGEEAPIADNDTVEGREANRRIEFKLIEQESASEDDPDEIVVTQEAAEELASEEQATTPTEGEEQPGEPEGNSQVNEGEAE